MPMCYKLDVLEMLREKGFTTYRLRRDGQLSEGCMQSLRENRPISWANIEKICCILNCQPGDILEYDGGEPNE